MRTQISEESVPSGEGRLGELYLRNANDGVRLAYLITGDLPLAEDLVQDAFVRLSGRLLVLRDDGAFEAYLRRTIVNLANSYFRRRKVEQRYVERERAGRPATMDAPDIAARDILRGALLALPVRQRTAIVLRFYEDLSEAQTADVMRCSVGNVKSLVSRGMEKLRPLMAGV